MLKKTLIVMFYAVLIASPILFAEHIISDIEVFAQYVSPVEVIGEKYFLEVDGQSFRILYGAGGSFESDIEKTYPATVSEIFLDKDSKSLNIKFERVPETQVFWIVLPTELISADKEEYQLLIDNVDTGYELAKMLEGYSLAFYLPENTQSVQIIGTHVVPEFGSITVIVLGICIMGTVLLFRKSGLLLYLAK